MPTMIYIYVDCTLSYNVCDNFFFFFFFPTMKQLSICYTVYENVMNINILNNLLILRTILISLKYEFLTICKKVKIG